MIIERTRRADCGGRIAKLRAEVDPSSFNVEHAMPCHFFFLQAPDHCLSISRRSPSWPTARLSSSNSNLYPLHMLATSRGLAAKMVQQLLPLVLNNTRARGRPTAWLQMEPRHAKVELVWLVAS